MKNKRIHINKKLLLIPLVFIILLSLFFGGKKIIDITNKSYLSGEIDLESYLDSVKIDAPKNQIDEYMIYKDSPYNITLGFKETENNQFPDTGTMAYRLPDGFNTTLTKTTEQQHFSIFLKTSKGPIEVPNNTYEIRNGIIYINWSSDPTFSNVILSKNIQFSITFTGYFDLSRLVIDFSDDISLKINRSAENHIEMEKTLIYSSDGLLEYSLNIKSYGDNSNINIANTIEGNSVSFNDQPYSFSNVTSSQIYFSFPNSKTMNINIPNMSSEETFTIIYSVYAEPTDLSVDSDNNFKISVQNNVSLTSSTCDPVSESSTDNIYFRVSIEKIGFEPGEYYEPLSYVKPSATYKVERLDYTNKKPKVQKLYNYDDNTIDWVIFINSDNKFNMSGCKIEDFIDIDSRQYISELVNNVYIKLYDEDNHFFTSYSVDLDELDSHNSYSWSYTLPEVNGKYEYVIRYQSRITEEALSQKANIKNKIKIGYSEGSTEYSVPDEPDNKIITKTVDYVDMENNYITWDVNYAVPSTNLGSDYAIITDYHPVYNGIYYEPIIPESIYVTGLIEGETYTVDSNEERTIIKFYKDYTKTELGFSNYDERYIHISYATSIAEEWKELAKTNESAEAHTNRVIVGEYSDQDTGYIKYPGLKNECEKINLTRILDGLVVPVYKCTVTFNNVIKDNKISFSSSNGTLNGSNFWASNYLDIYNYFDTRYFNIYEPVSVNDSFVLFGGNQSSQTNYIPFSKLNYVDTSFGILTRINENEVPLNGDDYYSYYKYSYYLTPKDVTAYNQVMNYAVQSDNGIYESYDLAKLYEMMDSDNISIGYNKIIKEVLTSEPNNEDLLSFRLTINPDGRTMNNHLNYTVEDSFTNLSILYSSINAPDSVSYHNDGDRLIFDVPDDTPLTITYDAKVLFNNNQQIEYSNVASYGIFSSDVGRVVNRNSSGPPTVYELTGVVGDSLDFSIKLPDAEFILLDSNKNPILDNNQEQVKYISDQNGKFKIGGANSNYAIIPDTVYYLREVVTPNLYLAPSEDIKFIITSDGTWNYTDEFASGDELFISNDPLETITVKVIWDDNNNQDGIRPNNLEFGLLKNNDLLDTKVFDSSNNWQNDFNNLVTYVNKSVIQYTVNAPENIPGYTRDVSDVVSGVLTVTYTHEPEKVNVSITKVWNDDNDRDGIRPSNLNVTLSNGQTVTLNQSNNWTQTINNLPKYNNGNLISYTWSEPTISGYTLQKNTTGYATTFTNTHTPEKVSISPTVLWNDNNNQDGIRPSSVTLQLYADGVEVGDQITVNGNTSWAHTFNNLPKYKNHGTPIVYTVDEIVVPSGYTKITPGTSSNGYVITNRHITEETSVTATKSWNDNNNQDGLRPSSITLQLYKDGTAEGQPVTLNSSNNWTYTWNNLVKYKNQGIPISYTVDEVNVPSGYTKTITGSMATGYTVTNSHTPATRQITITKSWDDNNDLDSKRPNSINVRLYKEGTAYGDVVTLNSSNNWTYTWSGLDKFISGGTPITYTVNETTVPDGYTKTITGTMDSGFTITNKLTPETRSITARKTWSDNSNQDGIRPSSVTIQLYKDGQPEGGTVTLNSSNNWTYTWNNLQKNKAHGTEYSYTVDEVSVPTNYTKNISGNMTNGYTITNSHAPDTRQITVTKSWDDNNDLDSKRPANISVRLYKEGTAFGDVITLNSSNNWTYTWTGLEKNSNGTPITYTVNETTVPDGYTKTITGTMDSGFTITNKLTPETRSIKATKTWDDSNNQDGIRPSSVTVQLYKDGTAEGQPVTLNSSNNWTYTWNSLQKNKAHGTEYSYTVDEVSVPTGYTKNINGNMTSGYTIKNTHAADTTQVKVTKAWDDNSNQDGIRPNSITVQLYKDGTAEGESVTLNSSNNWTHTWNNLQKNKNGGTPIVYTVDEPTVPTGYSKTISGTATSGFTITNKHVPETIALTVKKVWNDNNNQDGKRPTSLVATLSNGQTTTLNASNSWTNTINGLPKYNNGNLITYTWSEPQVEFYTSTKSTSGNTTTFTNTHTPGKKTVIFKNIWDDNNNQDGKRPNSITVTLKANGETVETYTVTNSESWEVIVNNLDEYKNGNLINYTWVESSIDGYSITNTNTVDNVTTVTNTHVPEKVNLTIKKDWKDENNLYNKRPNSIEVSLVENSTVVDTVTLSDPWQTTISKDKYRNGTEIEYTWVEGDLPEGYSLTNTKTEGLTTTLENTYTPEKTSATIKIVWDDDDDRDRVRPDSIRFRLSNGETVTLNEENNWTATINNLVKYNPNDEEIEYTWTEDSINGYEISNTTIESSTTIVTNKHEIEKVNISGNVYWDDQQNKDKSRPEEVKICVYDEDDLIDCQTIESSEESWRYSFPDLPKNKAGINIDYKLTEETIEGYKTEIEGFDFYNSYTNYKENNNGIIPFINPDTGNKIFAILVLILMSLGFNTYIIKKSKT